MPNGCWITHGSISPSPIRDVRRVSIILVSRRRAKASLPSWGADWMPPVGRSSPKTLRFAAMRSPTNFGPKTPRALAGKPSTPLVRPPRITEATPPARRTERRVRRIFERLNPRWTRDRVVAPLNRVAVIWAMHHEACSIRLRRKLESKSDGRGIRTHLRRRSGRGIECWLQAIWADQSEGDPLYVRTWL